MSLFRLTPLKITWSHTEALVSNLLKHKFVPSGHRNCVKPNVGYLADFNLDISRAPKKLFDQFGGQIREFRLKRLKDYFRRLYLDLATAFL